MTLLASSQKDMGQSINTNKPISFRRQLFTLFSIGAIILALAVSAIFAWLSSSQIEDLYVQEGLQATENFARDSELALLYESGENASDAANAVLAFPSVTRVFIINNKNSILLQKHSKTHHPSGNTISTKTAGIDKTAPDLTDVTRDITNIAKLKQAEIIYENKKAWFYANPVFTSKDEEQYIEGEAIVVSPIESEFLGYVVVAQDKNQLQEIQFSTFLKHLVVGFLYGAIVILFLFIALKQLLRPMDTLSEAMEETSKGDIHKIHHVHGPREIHQMIKVYNSMLDAIDDRDKQLREQNDKLELLVDKRTRELVIARDEALDASKQKSMFLANISHELRTPLQSIIGYSDIMQEALEDEGLEEFNTDLERIDYNAHHLLGLINSILDLSKIESGKSTLSLSETNINELLKQAESAAGPIVAQNENTFTIDAKGLERNVVIDQQKLLQVIINLLGNAGKFTENGNVTLSAELEPNLLSIHVKDTGIGIEEESQDSIFAPFRQVDGSFTRKFEGTGLGLSICKYFCEMMGGKIMLESEPGKGSTFSVYIPLPIIQDDD